MDLISKRQATRLTDAIAGSRRHLRPFRKARLDAVKEYTGRWYKGGDDAKLSVPVNMLGWMVQTYVRLLAARAPRGRITTIHKQHKRSVKLLELALDYTVKKLRLEDCFKKAVTNAMFGLSIVKTGLTGSVIKGFTDESGQPFADPVSLDDFFFDTMAKDMEEWQFAGDRYRVPKEYLEGNPHYAEMDWSRFTHEGSEGYVDDSVSRTESESRDGTYERYKPLVDLWDVWLPQDGLLVTLAGPLDGAVPVRTVEYTGPDHGPYHLLRYFYVPDQTMPLAPITLMMDLHKVINGVIRKMNKQSLNQKDIMLGRKVNEDDNKSILEADDQDFVQVDNTDQFGSIRVGGVDQSNLAYATILRQIYNEHAGGLSVLAGTSPMSETATQDRMLVAQATQQISDMQRETVSFAKGILEDLVFYLTRQPGINIPVSQRIAGIDLPQQFMSDEFDETMDIDIKVNPYSMQDQTPASVLQTLQGVVGQFIGNPVMAQMMVAQGKQIDVGKLIGKVGELTDIEEDLNEVIIGIDPSVQEQLGAIAGGGGGGGNGESKTYWRRSGSGMSQQGEASEMMRAAQGNQEQPGMQRAT